MVHHNPYHHHGGDISAVVYLKIPDGMEEELRKEYQDHYPSNGLIEFMYGENQDMRSDNIKFKPEVGTMLLFPSYLTHRVDINKSTQNRISISFNCVPRNS